MHCLAIKLVLKGKKIPIDTLMDQMQSVILVGKKFDSQEKSKTFAFSSNFGPESFPIRKMYRKMFF